MQKGSWIIRQQVPLAGADRPRYFKVDGDKIAWGRVWQEAVTYETEQRAKQVISQVIRPRLGGQRPTAVQITAESIFTRHPDRLQALSDTGLVYLHWKGGVYRAVGLAVPTPSSGTDDEALARNGLVIYEHLFPHARQFYVRPVDEFFDRGARDDQYALDERRFTPYSQGRPANTRLDPVEDLRHVMGVLPPSWMD